MTPEALATLYQLFGAALWHIQNLEDTLVRFLSLTLMHERRCAGETVSLEEFDALVADRRRLTFGPLIESCASRKVIRLEHRARFETFKTERHWLVHRSMVEIADDLYDPDGRFAALSRIDSIREESITLKKLVAADLFNWCERHGVDVAAADRQAKAELRRLRGY